MVKPFKKMIEPFYKLFNNT